MFWEFPIGCFHWRANAMRGQKRCRNSQKIELENFARWKNALNSGYKNVNLYNFTRERRMRKTQFFFAISVSLLVSHMVGSASRSAMPRGTIYQEVHIKKAFSLLGQSAGKTIRNLKPKKLKFPHSFANGFLCPTLLELWLIQQSYASC